MVTTNGNGSVIGTGPTVKAQPPAFPLASVTLTVYWSKPPLGNPLNPEKSYASPSAATFNVAPVSFNVIT